MTASALMMRACLLQQQQASASTALGFPGYFGLSPLFSSFLPTDALLGAFPRSLLGNSFAPMTASLTLPAGSVSLRLVMFVVLCLVYLTGHSLHYCCCCVLLLFINSKKAVFLPLLITDDVNKITENVVDEF